MTTKHHQHHPNNGYSSSEEDACGNYPPPPYDPCGYPPPPQSAQAIERYALVTTEGSRAAYAREMKFFSTDPDTNDRMACALVGGRNFPATTGSPSVWFPPEARGTTPQGQLLFYSDDPRSSVTGQAITPPRDETILSGGHMDNRSIVNLTNAELERRGFSWPMKHVRPGSLLEVSWEYRTTHPRRTRGYRFFITRDDWNPNRRVSRSSFELEPGTQLQPAPFYSDFNLADPYWTNSMLLQPKL